ncbi:hypothetical protein LY78DRAFT_472582 [Colletotrichum sublineola]|nr:hypothetical protein LY78DRAFT_472582 [Colletotrichum sublineola]
MAPEAEELLRERARTRGARRSRSSSVAVAVSTMLRSRLLRLLSPGSPVVYVVGLVKGVPSTLSRSPSRSKTPTRRTSLGSCSSPHDTPASSPGSVTRRTYGTALRQACWRDGCWPCATDIGLQETIL